MWNRACPLCFAKLPRKLVLTEGEMLNCPSCKTPVELSGASRVLAASCGLLAGLLAVRFVLLSDLPGAWALQVVAAMVAYVLGSALALYFFSDLVAQVSARASQYPQAQK